MQSNVAWWPNSVGDGLPGPLILIGRCQDGAGGRRVSFCGRPGQVSEEAVRWLMRGTRYV